MGILVTTPSSSSSGGDLRINPDLSLEALGLIEGSSGPGLLDENHAAGLGRVLIGLDACPDLLLPGGIISSISHVDILNEIVQAAGGAGTADKLRAPANSTWADSTRADSTSRDRSES
jgi:hypothetical protein